MMKFSNKILLLALAAVAAFSCKKDEETTSKTFGGSAKLEYPEFVEPGFTKKFGLDSLMTFTRDDGGPIGYFFTAPITSNRDTVCNGQGEVLHREYIYVAPDSLGNFSLTFTAFAEGYVNDPVYANFTVVRHGLNGKSSLTNFDIKDSDRTFTDPRDGQTYYYTTIGDTDWMRQNLAWAGEGRPYYNCEAMSLIFGRYYTWNEAQTACPEGWRLPSDEDWAAMASFRSRLHRPGRRSHGEHLFQRDPALGVQPRGQGDQRREAVGDARRFRKDREGRVQLRRPLQICRVLDFRRNR